MTEPKRAAGMQPGNGNGFKLGGYGNPPSASAPANPPKHIIRLSVAFKNVFAGFFANYHTTGNYYYSNTGFQNLGADFNMFGSNNVNTSILRNNLAYGPSPTLSLNGTDNAYNSWNLPVQVSDADFQSVDFAGMDGPRQADGSLPVVPFMRLVAGSDLIDKGVDIKLPFSGTAPDLGAYETGSTTGASGIGGGTGSGGRTGGSGGASGSGGVSSGGGVSSDGGASGGGGVSGGGGSAGVRGAGGASATGGVNVTGGLSATGGANTTGGLSAAGGANATGGMNAPGASGGVSATGGGSGASSALSEGGASASGGSHGLGGSGTGAVGATGGTGILGGATSSNKGGSGAAATTSGCSCRLGGQVPTGTPLACLFAMVFGLAALWRRRT
jgi:hypothetical protein